MAQELLASKLTNSEILIRVIRTGLNNGHRDSDNLSLRDTNPANASRDRPPGGGRAYKRKNDRGIVGNTLAEAQDESRPRLAKYPVGARQATQKKVSKVKRLATAFTEHDMQTTRNHRPRLSEFHPHMSASDEESNAYEYEVDPGS